MKILVIGGCGYLGSALHRHLSERHTVDSIDLEWFGNGVVPWNARRDYASLTRRELGAYEAVILLAGHSSVKMCAGPIEAPFRNNVLNFVSLLGELDRGQRFLYASSASVYPPRPEAASEEATLAAFSCAYGLMKWEIDEYAKASDVDFFGLRLGTVNGWAPHFRTDVMINRMVESARRGGVIELSNPDASRPLLGIDDLCRAVDAILDAERPPRGIYNLASFNATVREIGTRTALAVGADVALRPPTPTSDMRMATALFERTFGFRFQDTVESIAAGLVARWEQGRTSTREEQRPYV